MKAISTIASLVGGLALGCSNGPAQERTPYGEHRPQTAVTVATKHLGEDCSSAGYQDCVSQVCGHFAAAPESGYFCTRSCTSSIDCPRGWSCAQVYPSDDGRLCIAPSDWDGGVALLRDGGVQ